MICCSRYVQESVVARFGDVGHGLEVLGRARERRGVCHALCVATILEEHAQVDCQRHPGHDADQRHRDDDEGSTAPRPFCLTALRHTASSQCTARSSFLLLGRRPGDGRREVVQAMQPLISEHFNLTVEMPLKAIVRGYTYKAVPIRWTNRKAGISKLKIQEMGSRYLFIVLYLWLEKYLSRGDYHRSTREPHKEPPIERHV